MALFTRKTRKASFFLLLAIVVFVALEAIAMVLYPGGTWLNRSSTGHDFFRNFFCDVAASKALNGQPNPGAIFAKAGMFVFTLGLFPFWVLITNLVRTARARLAKVVLVLGTLSSIASALVPFVSSQQYGFLHPLLIFLAGIPGLMAGGLSTYGLVKAKSGSRIPARLAVLTVLLVAVDGALYAVHVLTGQEIGSALLPTLQKLAALSLVAWMVSAAISGKTSR
jgi:hypothetical protein